MTARKLNLYALIAELATARAAQLTESGVEFATAGTFGLIAVGDLYFQEAGGASHDALAAANLPMTAVGLAGQLSR